MRLVQGHSRGQEIYPKHENIEPNSYGRSDYMITSDQRVICGPFLKEVSLQEESDVEKVDRHATFIAIGPRIR